MSTAPAKRGFVAPIEGVRGLAALFVAAGHGFANTIAGDWHDVLARPFSSAGLLQIVHGLLVDQRAAVVIFFVISGFVLGRSLDATPAGGFVRRYAGFIWRRIWRIYPAHIAVLLAIAAAMHAIMDAHPVDLRGYGFIHANFVSGSGIAQLGGHPFLANLLLKSNAYNLVTWSLGVEMAMAFLLPLLHPLARRGSLGLDVTILAGFGLGTAWFAPAYGHEAWYFLVYLPAFYLGLLIETRGRDLVAWSAARRMPAGRSMVLLYLGLAVLSHLATVSGRWEDGCAELEALFGFAILSVLVWQPDGGAGRFAARPEVRWLGRRSYSFYLWHWPVLCFFLYGAVRAFSATTLIAHQDLLFAVALAITIPFAALLASVSYRLIERPANAWARGRHIPLQSQGPEATEA